MPPGSPHRNRATGPGRALHKPHRIHSADYPYQDIHAGADVLPGLRIGQQFEDVAKQLVFMAQSFRSPIRAQVAGTVETGKEQRVCECLGVGISKPFIRRVGEKGGAPVGCELGQRRIGVPSRLEYLVA